MTFKLATYIKPIAVLIAVMFSLQLNAQRNSKWRIAKSASVNSDTITVVEIPMLDSLKCISLPELSTLPTDGDPGVFTLNMDSTITEIDKSTRLNIKPIIGFRIQIFFGELGSAREIKAKFRKESRGADVYLVANGPMYTVSIGNYRTKWDAQNDFLKLVKKYKEALILESEIELPDLY
jgi:hypothetical protein|tara:strand:+ start:117 stop:653 length:537 start_codon:yes stop_codon:yes gene_type:complete